MNPLKVVDEKPHEGRKCCGAIPNVLELDTGERFMGRYEYQVECPKCFAHTISCWNCLDAKKLWDFGEVTCPT